MFLWASLLALLVKNLPAMQETWVWSLRWEDPLEKGKATHSGILAWRIPWTVVHESQRVGHEWATFTFSLFSVLRRSHCEDREEGHVTTEAETEGVRLKPRNADDRQQAPKLDDWVQNRRGFRNSRNQTCCHFDFRPLVSWTVRQ